MTVETITIPASQAMSVAAKIAKLSKKAKKYGNDDISVSFSDTFASKYTIQGVEYEMMMINATVMGDAPVYEGGWKLIARLEILENSNLIHEVPNTINQIDPRFRNHSNVCEHCMKDRRRNDLFVFEGENGDQVAVGRTCLHDFMGIDNPQMIVQRAAFFESLKKISDEEFASYISVSFHIKDALEIAAAEIRSNGWVSKSVASEQGIRPTADVVAEFLNGSSKNNLVIEDQDVKMAESVIEYFKNMEISGNNYLDNLSVLAKETVANKKLIGLVVSAISAYKRQISSEIAKKEVAKNSDFVGTVKERLRDLVLTLKKEIFIGSHQFGDKFLYSFVDQNGNVVNWFTSVQDIEENKTYTFDATVKEHKVYDGINQTIVTRAKIK